MKTSEFAPGAYYTYTPKDRHCHEGTLLAVRDEGGVYLVDTFWGPKGDASLSLVRPRDEALATAEFLFNPADGWEPAGQYLQIGDFDDDDVRTVTSQHGLLKAQWIRTGSGPSDEKRLANARERTAEARRQIDSAIREYGWAVREEQRLCDEINTAYAAAALASGEVS